MSRLLVSRSVLHCRALLLSKCVNEKLATVMVQSNSNRSNCRRVCPGDVAVGHVYAGDTGVVSQSPQQLRNIIRVIVVVCASFGLTVSEAKTKIVCLRTKGVSGATAIFSVEAAG